MTNGSVPRGIFRRETKGADVEVVPVTLERSRLVSFSRVLGEVDPIHVDPAEAQAQGYPDVVATASFASAVELFAGQERNHRGLANLTELVGADYRRLLHGEQAYIYHGLMFAGDTVTVGGTVVDFYDRSGGRLEFVVLSSTISHPDRGVLVEAKRTLIHRLAS